MIFMNFWETLQQSVSVIPSDIDSHSKDTTKIIRQKQTERTT